MKTLVILKAKANHGKTGTLDRLIDKIKDSDLFHLIYPKVKDDITSFVIGQYGAYRFGIITFGDPGCEDELSQCLNSCLDYDCDVVVCASRTKGAVYEMLYTFGKDHHTAILETSPLYLYDSWDSTIDCNALNDLTATMLFRFLTETILN